MKAKIKTELNKIVIESITEYKGATDEKSKLAILHRLTKEINTLKDVENQEIENRVKIERSEIDLMKFELDKSKYELDVLKLDNEINKTESTIKLDNRRVENDILKIDNDVERLNLEKKFGKIDRVMNCMIKTLEIGVPLLINTGLTLMLFRLIYKDDGRAPSELKDLMRHIYKK